MAGAPEHVPRLPIERPRGRDWQVKVVRVAGRYALSLWRKRGSRFLYPNQVVEKELGVTATTRNWNTMRRLRDRLREDG